MSKFKGTPGPWFWESSVLCNKDFIVGGNGHSFHNQANKNLIAAAPELLEALQLFASQDIMAQLNGSEFEEPTDDEEWVKFRFIAKDFRKAAAAIAKALGESK